MTPARLLVALGFGLAAGIVASVPGVTVWSLLAGLCACVAGVIGGAAPRAGVQAAPPPAEPSDLSALRHDIRGILSPMLLGAERLTLHADPAVRSAGEMIMAAVTRVTDRLAERPEARS